MLMEEMIGLNQTGHCKHSMHESYLEWKIKHLCDEYLHDWVKHFKIHVLVKMKSYTPFHPAVSPFVLINSEIVI